MMKSCVPLEARLWIKSPQGPSSFTNDKRGTAMNQQTIVEPATTDAISSVQGLVHDGKAQMNSATKGIVHTIFDISVPAMQQYQRLAEQNPDVCNEMQYAFPKERSADT